MDEEMLMSSIMKDIDECRDKRSETLLYLIFLIIIV